MTEKYNLPRLLLKTACFIALIAFVLIPVGGGSFGRLSLYNGLLKGRLRFPYSDDPRQSYSLSLYNLDAMFSSHQVSKPFQESQEIRIFILGDSSIWGTLLKPEETLAGQLNRMDLHSAAGTPLHFYNLGYPTLSLTKDLLLLEQARQYQPDLIIWAFTLESFPQDKQLASPIVKNNPEAVLGLINQYELNLSSQTSELSLPTYWDQTLFGQRRNLADLFRLQLYGIMWTLTGIDQYYPPDYTKAARDLENDSSFHDFQPGELSADDLALDLLQAGSSAGGDVPMLLVNEPILISEGQNSAIRYNHYYPRWAYDQYRQILTDFTQVQGLEYIDLWDLVPQADFTNTAIHTNPAGTLSLAENLVDPIFSLLDP